MPGAPCSLIGAWRPCSLIVVPQAGEMPSEVFTHQSQQQSAGCRGLVLQAVFSPRELKLVTAGEDAEVRVWDLTKKACIATLKVSHLQLVIGGGKACQRWTACASQSSTMQQDYTPDQVRQTSMGSGGALMEHARTVMSASVAPLCHLRSCCTASHGDLARFGASPCKPSSEICASVPERHPVITFAKN